MAWLPGHTCVGSAVVVIYAQISPSRFTTAPHIRAPPKRPPAFGSFAAASIAWRNSEAEGTSLQFAAAASVAEHNAAATSTPRIFFIALLTCEAQDLS